IQHRSLRRCAHGISERLPSLATVAIFILERKSLLATLDLFLNGPPHRHTFGHCRISTRQQQLQLMCLQRQARLIAFGPPSESTFRQPSLTKPESPPVVVEDFYGFRSPVPENE